MAIPGKGRPQARAPEGPLPSVPGNVDALPAWAEQLVRSLTRRLEALETQVRRSETATSTAAPVANADGGDGSVDEASVRVDPVSRAVLKYSSLKACIDGIDALFNNLQTAVVRAFSARKDAAAQVIAAGSPGTVTKVTFDAEDSGGDPSSMYDASTSVFTAPETAWYDISCTLQLEATSGTPTAVQHNLYLYLNGGAKELAVHEHGTPAQIKTIDFSTSIPLTAGNTLEIYLGINATGAADFTIANNANTKFQVRKRLPG